jgi:AT-binding transcription factor 1
MRASTRCALCRRAFKSTDALKRHVLAEHAAATPAAQSMTDAVESTGADTADALDTTVSTRINHAKYLDVTRPFKCDVCKDSFTQKSILQVHFNSVSHLRQTKRLLEQQQKLTSVDNRNGETSVEQQNSLTNGDHCDMTATPATDSVHNNNNHPTVVNHNRPYRCNICKHSCSQGSTFDIHLRSVAHQSRVAKWHELVATGEIDISQPLIEQPDNPKQTQQHKVPTAATVGNTDAMTMMMFQMSHMNAAAAASSLLAPAAHQHHSAFPPCTSCGVAFNSAEHLFTHTCATADSMNTADRRVDGLASSAGQSSSSAHRPQSGFMFRKLLENYGFDMVMQYCEAHHQHRRRRRFRRPADNVHDSGASSAPEHCGGNSAGDMPELGECECQTCGKLFSSIWVLKAHCEHTHKEAVPAVCVERLSESLREAYEEQGRRASAPPPPTKPIDDAAHLTIKSPTCSDGGHQQFGQTLALKKPAAAHQAQQSAADAVHQQQQQLALEQLTQLANSQSSAQSAPSMATNPMLMNQALMNMFGMMGANPNAAMFANMGMPSFMGTNPFLNPMAAAMMNPQMMATAAAAAAAMTC